MSSLSQNTLFVPISLVKFAKNLNSNTVWRHKTVLYFTNKVILKELKSGISLHGVLKEPGEVEDK